MLAPWVMDEMQTADLDDKRLDVRLKAVLSASGAASDREHSCRLWRAN